MADERIIQDIAAQLRQPEGKKGLDMADMMHQTNIAMTLHSLDCLELCNHLHVLELGHGNCAHLPLLLERHIGLKYTGLEISTLMQEEAIRLNQTAIEQKNAQFLLYDGLHLENADAQFDRIFSVNTLYFWQDPQALLNELYRVLKPQGVLNISFADKKFMQQLPFTQYNFELYDLEKLARLVEQTSFQLKNTATAHDQVQNKLGVWVEREFITVSLYKDSSSALT